MLNQKILVQIFIISTLLSGCGTESSEHNTVANLPLGTPNTSNVLEVVPDESSQTHKLGTASSPKLNVLEEATLWANKNAGALISKASNDEAIEFAIVFSETANYLATTDEKKCMKMILPSIFGPLMKNEWPKQFLDRQMAIQRKFTATALSNPHEPPSEDEAGPIFDSVLEILETKYNPNTGKLLGISDNHSELKLRCEAWANLYRELSKLPPNQGGAVVRWLNAP